MCERIVTPEGYILVKSNIDNVKIVKIYDAKNRLIEYENSIGMHFLYSNKNIPIYLEELKNDFIWG